VQVGGHPKAPRAGSQKISGSGGPEGLSTISESVHRAVWPRSCSRKQKP